MSKKPKIEYKNLQFPKIMIENAELIMYKFGYRNPHEYFIDAGRRRTEELIKLTYQMEQLKSTSADQHSNT